MRENEYSEAAVEVLDILNYTNQEDVRKIPQSFIKFLIDISSKTYRVNFNHEQPIGGLNIKKQTRELLGFIYITWWSNNEEFEKYKKIINSSQNKTIVVQERRNDNNFFSNNKEINVNKEEPKNMAITEYKKESWITRFFNKMKEYFKK